VAEQACYIEMELAGHPVGKHDHYLAAFGGITSLEICTDGRVQVSPLNISVTTVEDFRANVLLFYTGMTRSSLDILGTQRNDTENGDPEVIDSLHRTKELGYRIKGSLEEGDIERFGLLLDEHWQNKKRRSAKITDHNIDRWYDLAKANGATGGKIMGAGGGGFFMFCCLNGAKARVRQALAAEGLQELSYDFDFEGAKVMVNF
jgi:D-glycero-alpha-D-manno-heptose-7-phosphate kinase